MRSRNSEREESIGGGEARPVEHRRRALLASSRCAPRKEKGGTGWDRKLRVSAWLRAALNSEVGRDCRRVDVLAGDHSGGMGVGAQYRAQERHCLLV